MEARDAAAVAKGHVRDLFSDETITDVLLEEIRFDEQAAVWTVTIGFTRKGASTDWDNWHSQRDPIAEALAPPRHRVYKVISLADADGAMLEVTDRRLALSGS